MLKIIQWAFLSFLFLAMTNQAYGAMGLEFEAAKSRASQDVRKQQNRDRLDRQDQWSERDDGVIQISNTGYQPTTYSEIDFESDDESSGEDQSGLNRLRGTVEEESTDIDFDQELQEVGAFTDTDHKA